MAAWVSSVSRAEDAVTAREADALFACLSSYDHVLIAVSGGPDSTALLVLLSEWRQRRSAALEEHRPKLSVATVDHRLRPQAAEEARAVADLSAALGLPHATLVWEGEKPATGLPNAARNARYALLEAHIDKRGLPGSARVAVVTAHTEDDQAETVLMRLARGGGIRALAGIPAKRAVPRDAEGQTQIDIVRPLLAVAKRRLLATLDRRRIAYCEDPTNADMRFERPRVRAFLASSGLDAAALTRFADEMRAACAVLEDAKTKLAAEMRIATNGGIFLRAERRPFCDALPLLQRELLRDMVMTFGGDTAAPETAELDRAVARLVAGRGEDDARFTLAGAVVSAGRRYLRIWREPARIKDRDVIVPPAATVIWDRRFRVANGGETELIVRPLGKEACTALRPEFMSELRAGIENVGDLPSAAVQALPAIHHRGGLIAVPQLGYFADGGTTNESAARAANVTCTPVLHPLGA